MKNNTFELQTTLPLSQADPTVLQQIASPVGSTISYIKVINNNPQICYVRCSYQTNLQATKNFDITVPANTDKDVTAFPASLFENLTDVQVSRNANFTGVQTFGNVIKFFVVTDYDGINDFKLNTL